MFQPDKETIESFKKEIDRLLIRYWLRIHISNYDDKQTYVIYDGKNIEIYNEQFFRIKKKMRHFKSYFISRPIRTV